MVPGTPMRAIVSRITAEASDIATPSARLNEIVAAANCPWWFTDRGASVGS